MNRMMIATFVALVSTFALGCAVESKPESSESEVQSATIENDDDRAVKNNPAATEMNESANPMKQVDVIDLKPADPTFKQSDLIDLKTRDQRMEQLPSELRPIKL